MAKLLKNKAKLILLIYIVILVVLAFYGLFFMTNYINVHIAYNPAGDSVEFSRMASFDKMSIYNNYLFDYFRDSEVLPSDLVNVTNAQFVDVENGYAWTIYDFHQFLNGVNTFIIVSSFISIALIAVFFIFSNNNRRIYYKSNLLVGFFVPLIIIVLQIVTMVLLISATSKLNADLNLYKVTAAMMNDETALYYNQAVKDWSIVEAHSSSVNSVTFVVGIVLSILTIAYSAFVFVFTAKKYKDTAKERAEIINRAVTAND